MSEEEWKFIETYELWLRGMFLDPSVPRATRDAGLQKAEELEKWLAERMPS